MIENSAAAGTSRKAVVQQGSSHLEAQSEDRFFYQRADAVVLRLFMAGSDLHAVRSRIEDPAAALHSTAQIDDAIRKVDAAINDLRYMIFERRNG